MPDSAMSLSPKILDKKYTTKNLPVLSILLRRISLLLGAGLAVYCALVLLLMTPWAQTHVVYAHRFDHASSGFQHAEDYGLAPGKTINLRLRAADGTSLGAWFVLSDPVYRSLPFPPTASANDTDTDTTLIKNALRASPTLLFLHGNSGTRALRTRTALYTALTARLSANVLALDYRGFADSTGHPTVRGVAMDARAAWDWLTLVHGADPADVIVVGHSLGTAVAGLLAAQLGRESVYVRGVALLAPFSSVKLLMDQYAIMGVPLLKPLAKLPFVPRLLAESIAHNFDTLSQIPDIAAPVYIAHALDDADIPHTHADILFDALLERYIVHPALDLVHSTTGAVVANATADLDSDSDLVKDLDLHSNLDSDSDSKTDRNALPRAATRERLVTRTEVPHFGVVHEFEAPEDGRRVVLLKTRYGGHDVGRLEGVQDVLARVFGL